MALPLKKRPYRGTMAVSNKRIRRLERQVAANRPEMKSVASYQASTAVATGAIGYKSLSIINQGDGSSQRIGSTCKLWRMELRGQIDPLLDIYLIQSKDGSVPTYSDFDAYGSGFVDSENNNFVEWKFLRVKPDQTTNCPWRITQKFNGMKMEFQNAGGTPFRNSFWLVIKNDSGASLNYTVQVKKWFTDP